MRICHPHCPIFGLPPRGWLLAFGILLLGGCAQFPYPLSPSSEQPTAADAAAEAETQAEQEAAAAQPIPEPQEDPEPGKLYEWHGGTGKISHVVIDTTEQRARFYDGQKQVGWTTIASGVSSHPTPSGEFEVIEKVAKKRSNLYGRIYNASGGLHKRNAHSRDPIPAGGKFVGARMPHFMRMTYDGIGMHAGPIPRPGQPASHGCIRLPSEVATSLFSQVDIGTRVTVVGNGPDYGNYAERIRRQREQERLNRIAAAEEAEREPPQKERPARQRQASTAGEPTDARSRSRERDQRRAATNETSSDASRASGLSDGSPAPATSVASEPRPASVPSPSSADQPSDGATAQSGSGSQPQARAEAGAADQAGDQAGLGSGDRSDSGAATESEAQPTTSETTPAPSSTANSAANSATGPAPTPAPAPPEVAPEPQQTPGPETPSEAPSAPESATADTTAASGSPDNRGARGTVSEDGRGDASGATAPTPQPTAPHRSPKPADPEIRSAERDQHQDSGA